MILKEREEKKRLRLLEDTDPMQVPSGDDPSDDPAETAAETRLPDESDYSQEGTVYGCVVLDVSYHSPYSQL